MSKNSARRKYSKKQKKPKEWPLVVYMWIFGLALSGYLLARIGLYNSPHPIHWLSGLAGGVLGIGVGWAWYLWKGDVS